MSRRRSPSASSGSGSSASGSDAEDRPADTAGITPAFVVEPRPRTPVQPQTPTNEPQRTPLESVPDDTVDDAALSSMMDEFERSLDIGTPSQPSTPAPAERVDTPTTPTTPLPLAPTTATPEARGSSTPTRGRGGRGRGRGRGSGSGDVSPGPSTPPAATPPRTPARTPSRTPSTPSSRPARQAQWKDDTSVQQIQAVTRALLAEGGVPVARDEHTPTDADARWLGQSLAALMRRHRFVPRNEADLTQLVATVARALWPTCTVVTDTDDDTVGESWFRARYWHGEVGAPGRPDVVVRASDGRVLLLMELKHVAVSFVRSLGFDDDERNANLERLGTTTEALALRHQYPVYTAYAPPPPPPPGAADPGIPPGHMRLFLDGQLPAVTWKQKEKKDDATGVTYTSSVYGDIDARDLVLFALRQVFMYTEPAPAGGRGATPRRTPRRAAGSAAQPPSEPPRIEDPARWVVLGIGRRALVLSTSAGFY